MWYLTLPPIIVIAALVGLVYFFSRRFPRVEKEITAHLSDPEVKSAYNLHIFDSLKRGSLYILERLAQWFKVMTLRTYNALHSWTQSIREKKSKTPVKPAVIVSEDAAPQRREETQAPPQPEARDRRIRPMVSQRVAQPEPRVKPSVAKPSAIIEPPSPAIKNQLEDILVERIAANPRDLEAYERLGEYYMEQGNLQDAKECYRQVLRLSPVHRLAKIKIRRLEKMLEQK
ncbi:MAG: tetratricopeptide repeat protein [Candidatus Moranbacteria bacterium]|nr:tetratricopeptide repeat protein [Candidatus Moranbacteria bacterium]